MKYLILFSAVVLAASALPAGDLAFEAIKANATRSLERQTGFASFGAGTWGGRGGSTWTVWDAWALRDAIRTSDARIVYVRGRIDLTPLFTGSPGVQLDVGSFTSIIGGDGNAEIFGGGIRIVRAQQVIVQNIKFNNALNYAPGEQPNGNGGIISMVPGAFSTIDAIEVTESEFVWVDHCEFSDDPWISNDIPEERRRHDGLIDIVRGSNWVTVSNSIFRNHNMVMLVGNSDTNVAQDRGRLRVTYVGNWFMGTSQRNPRVRFGAIHLLNNLYTDLTFYGVGVGVESQIHAERNVFINVNRAWVFAAATPIPEPMGYLLNDNNLLQNSGHDSGIPSYGVTFNPRNYYSYTAQAVGNVEWSVRNNAGVW